MATREADRTLQRCWMARVRSASLPSIYTTCRDTTARAVLENFQGVMRYLSALVLYQQPLSLNRHPSESWDLFSFFSNAIKKSEIPAFQAV
jgi:hypothetical protein